MRQTLTKKFNKPVKVIFNTFKLGQCFTLKSKTPKQLLENVVYKLFFHKEKQKKKKHLATGVEEHLSLPVKAEGDFQIKNTYLKVNIVLEVV